MVVILEPAVGTSLLRTNPAPRQGSLAFRIASPGRQGQIIRLATSKALIGAGANCQLRLKGAGVRQAHCLVLSGPSGVFVRCVHPDTRINGWPFQDAQIVPGDRLTVGAVELEFVEASAPPSPRPELFEQARSARLLAPESTPSVPAADSPQPPSANDQATTTPTPATSAAELPAEPTSWEQIPSPQLEQLERLTEHLRNQIRTTRRVGHQRLRTCLNKIRSVNDGVVQLQSTVGQLQTSVDALSVRQAEGERRAQTAELKLAAAQTELRDCQEQLDTERSSRHQDQQELTELREAQASLASQWLGRSRSRPATEPLALEPTPAPVTSPTPSSAPSPTPLPTASTPETTSPLATTSPTDLPEATAEYAAVEEDVVSVANDWIVTTDVQPLVCEAIERTDVPQSAPTCSSPDCAAPDCAAPDCAAPDCNDLSTSDDGEGEQAELSTPDQPALTAPEPATEPAPITAEADAAPAEVVEAVSEAVKTNEVPEANEVVETVDEVKPQPLPPVEVTRNIFNPFLVPPAADVADWGGQNRSRHHQKLSSELPLETKLETASESAVEFPVEAAAEQSTELDDREFSDAGEVGTADPAADVDAWESVRSTQPLSAPVRDLANSADAEFANHWEQPGSFELQDHFEPPSEFESPSEFEAGHDAELTGELGYDDTEDLVHGRAGYYEELLASVESDEQSAPQDEADEEAESASLAALRRQLAAIRAEYSHVSRHAKAEHGDADSTCTELPPSEDHDELSGDSSWSHPAFSGHGSGHGGGRGDDDSGDGGSGDSHHWHEDGGDERENDYDENPFRTVRDEDDSDLAGDGAESELSEADEASAEYSAELLDTEPYGRLAPAESEEGDAIQTYMNQLMQRVGATSFNPQVPAAPSRAAGSPNSAAAPTAPAAPSAKAEAATSKPSTSQPQSLAKTTRWIPKYEPKDGSSPAGRPKQTPEQLAKLDAFRDVANQTARIAITRYTMEETRQAVLLRASIAFGGLAVGGIIANLSTAVFSTLNLLAVTCWVVAAVALASSVQIYLKSRLNARTKVAKGARGKAVDPVVAIDGTPSDTVSAVNVAKAAGIADTTDRLAISRDTEDYRPAQDWDEPTDAEVDVDADLGKNVDAEEFYAEPADELDGEHETEDYRSEYADEDEADLK
ncbi:MAG: hypothetical protein U0795_09045 [Pirellulales bacterium]